MGIDTEEKRLFSGNRALGRIVLALVMGTLVLFGGHATAKTITVDGNPGDWAGISPIITSTQAPKFRSLSVTNDAVFVYFLAEFTSDITGNSNPIVVYLDPDLNGTFYCEAGIAIGIDLDSAQPSLGRIKPNAFGSCSFTSDFPGAVTVVASGRFIEASVSLSALKQIAPSLTSFDILVNAVGGIPDYAQIIGRYVIQTDTPPSVPPRLTLSVNERAFSAGDPLRVGLLAVNPGPSFNADFYFGYLMPDGVTAFFLTSLTPLNGVMVRMDGSPQAFKPLAANVLIPQGLNVALDDVSVFTFSGSDPTGTYVFFEALTPPNAFADGQVQAGDILALDSKAFTVQPPPTPGWYRNSGPTMIYETSTGLRTAWENSYIYQHPGTDNLYWYAQVVYQNVGSYPIRIQCEDLTDPSLAKEHMRGTPDAGTVAASETFCSRNPDFSTSLDPGEVHYSWAIFHNVPPGGEVALEWMPYGSSAWVNPWASRFSAPPPAECPPELVALGTCYPVLREPDGKTSNLIVLVHGCCTDENGVINVWDSLGRLIAGKIQAPGTWEIVVWDWSAYTPTNGGVIFGLANALAAYNNAIDRGHDLATAILKGKYGYIHLIGHSSGANLIQQAAKDLIANNTIQQSKPFIHLTFLDAFTPVPPLSNYSDDKGYGYLEGYPNHYSEHYVTTCCLPYTDSFLKNAFNFDITDWINMKDNTDSGHQWPRIWYTRSVESPTRTGVLGFMLSLEGGNKAYSTLSQRFRPVPPAVPPGNICQLTNVLTTAICGINLSAPASEAR